MSVLGQVAEPVIGKAKTLAVEVKSVLEEALGSLPDKPMAKESVYNAVKNKGTQDIEIQQSGFDFIMRRYADESGKVSPKSILANLVDTRPDRYEIAEIKGVPKGSVEAKRIELLEDARGVLDEVGMWDPDNIIENSDDLEHYTQTLRNQLEEMEYEADGDDYRLAEVRDFINRMEDVQNRLAMAEARQRVTEKTISRYQDAIEAVGDDGISVTPNFLPKYINNIKDGLAEGRIVPGEDVPENFLDTLTSALQSLDPAPTDLQTQVYESAKEALPKEALETLLSNPALKNRADVYEMAELLTEKHGRAVGFTLLDVVEDIWPGNEVFVGEVPASKLAIKHFGAEYSRLTMEYVDDAIDQYIASSPNFDDLLADMSGPPKDRFLQELHAVREFIILNKGEVDLNDIGGEGFQFPEKAYINVTLPDTDKRSYAVRLYKNRAVDLGNAAPDASHWFETPENLNYVFHTRTDKPRRGVHRIQEIQSDMQNNLSEQKEFEVTQWRNAPYTPYRGTINEKDLLYARVENVSKEESQAITNLKRDTFAKLNERIAKELPSFVPKLNIEQDWRTHNTIVRFYDDLFKGTDIQDRVYTYMRSPKEGRREQLIESLHKKYPEEDKTTIEQVIDFAKTIEDRLEETAKPIFAKQEEEALEELAKRRHPEGRIQTMAYNLKTLSKTERLALDDALDQVGLEYKELNLTREMLLEVLTGKRNLRAMSSTELRKDVERKLRNSTILPETIAPPKFEGYNLPIPYIKQGLQEEIIHAIKNGDREVWLTVSPEDVLSLSRGQGPQKSYESGAINKTFRKLASRFDATLVEEDGYLKMKLPVDGPNNSKKYAIGAGGAAVLSIPAYAETNNQDFRRNAFSEGYTTLEVDQYIAENPLAEEEQPLWYEQAKAMGYSEEEITQYQYEEWLKELGDEDLGPTPEVLYDENSDLPLAPGETQSKPTYSRLPVETVQELAIELGANPVTPTGIDTIYKEYLRRTDPDEYNRAFANTEISMDTVYQMADIIELSDVDRPFLLMRSLVGDAEATAMYEKGRAEDRQRVIDTAKEFGHEVVYGTGPTDEGGNGLEADVPFIMVERADGTKQPVLAVPNFFSAEGFTITMARYFGETAGGIAGFAKGMEYAGKAGAVMDPALANFPLGRMISAGTKFGIVTGMTAAGAIVGDQLDYTAAAIRQDQDLEWSVAFEKAVGAAQASVVADVIGTPLIMLGKAAISKAMYAFREVQNGNLKAAYASLKEITGLSDDQVDEIIERWKKLNTPDAVDQPLQIQQQSKIPFSGGTKTKVLNREEEALAIVPITKAGGEALVNAAATIDQRASYMTAREVNKRAQNLLQESRSRLAAVTDSSDLVLDAQKALDDYITSEKTMYDQVRTTGSDIVHSANPGYQFNIERTVLKPLLETIESTIGKVGKAEQAARTIDLILQRNRSGTFDDLIDMRQLMNELFNSARGGLKYKHLEAFKEVMATIDDEIVRAMPDTTEGKVWLKDWDNARASYGRMKDLTSNALAKAMRREGTNPEDLAKALIKYGKASDGTYTDLIKELDPKLWGKVEISMVNQLVEKWTFGMEGEFRAVHFPELDKALSTYDFTTPDAAQLQSAIGRLAEVYTNDTILARMTGTIRLTAPQQALTTDLVAKAHYSLASKVWNHLQRYLGTSNANMQSAVRIVANFMENPLDAATVKEAINVAKGDTALIQAIEELQKQVAASQARGVGNVKAKIFTNGKGQYSYEPKEGYTWNDKTVPVHTIVSRDIVADKLKLDPDNLSEVDKRLLKGRGFKAIGATDGTLIMLE